MAHNPNPTPPADDADGIKQVIAALVAAGYQLDHVNDGEEDVPVSTEAEALAAITAVDDAYLIVTPPTKSGQPARFGSHVRFVLGNEPFEVVNDYGASLDHVLGPLTASWDY